MAVIPITQLMGQAEQGIAQRQQNQRKQGAYNALRQQYGPIAGDPQAARQMQTYEFDQQANPLRLTGMEQQNALNRQSFDFNEQYNPLRIEEAQVGIEGGRIGNRAADAEVNRAGFLEAATYARQRIAEGVDPGQAYDEVSGQLPLTPEQSTQAREAIVNNPGELDNFIASLDGGRDVEAGLRPIRFRDAEGNVRLGQMTKDGRVVATQTPEGWQPEPDVTLRDLGDRVGVLGPQGQLMGTYQKGGAPSGDQRPAQPGFTPAQPGPQDAPPAQMPPSGGQSATPRQTQGGSRTAQAAPDQRGGLEPIPGSARAAEAQTKETAKAGLSDTLEGVTRTYLKLDEMGAITNPDEGWLTNPIARLRNTTVGQLAEGAVGTEAQSLRERINNVRPLLINTIRQASEMSARGLDSNRELDFYLQAATDPTKDLYSNLVAIDVLDKTYGAGGVVKDTVPKDVYERISEQATLDMKNMPIPSAEEAERRAEREDSDSDEDFNRRFNEMFGSPD